MIKILKELGKLIVKLTLALISTVVGLIGFAGFGISDKLSKCAKNINVEMPEKINTAKEKRG